MAKKFVFLHDFTNEEILKILKAVKGVIENPQDIAFSKSTKINMEFKVKDLIRDVHEDHAYLRENPPSFEKKGK